jgi:hypothetical protein
MTFYFLELINKFFKERNMKGQMLDIMKEDPIELCHFSCVETDEFKDVFEGHCLSCKEITGDSSVESLPKQFKGCEDSDEAWEALAKVYCKHGFDTYNSDEYFEVYPAE